MKQAFGRANLASKLQSFTGRIAYQNYVSRILINNINSLIILNGIVFIILIELQVFQYIKCERNLNHQHEGNASFSIGTFLQIKKMFLCNQYFQRISLKCVSNGKTCANQQIYVSFTAALITANPLAENMLIHKSIKKCENTDCKTLIHQNKYKFQIENFMNYATRKCEGFLALPKPQNK